MSLTITSPLVPSILDILTLKILDKSHAPINSSNESSSAFKTISFFVSFPLSSTKEMDNLSPSLPLIEKINQ